MNQKKVDCRIVSCACLMLSCWHRKPEASKCFSSETVVIKVEWKCRLLSREIRCDALESTKKVFISEAGKKSPNETESRKSSSGWLLNHLPSMLFCRKASEENELRNDGNSHRKVRLSRAAAINHYPRLWHGIRTGLVDTKAASFKP